MGGTTAEAVFASGRPMSPPWAAVVVAKTAGGATGAASSAGMVGLARGADAGRPPATAPATGAVLGTGGLLARGVPLGAEGGLVSGVEESTERAVWRDCTE